MVLGIPLVAVAYALLQEAIQRNLEKKGKWVPAPEADPPKPPKPPKKPKK